MILSPNELKELEDELEILSLMCAEDANEAAMFGDGPCGSFDRALAYNKALRKYKAHQYAVAGETENDKIPVATVEEDFIPF